MDYAPLLRFVLFALLSTPPNFLWQLQLESWFPSHVPTLTPVRDDKVQAGEKEDVKTKLSVTNTLAKFATDQLAGGPVNTVLFLAFMGYARGLAGPALLSYVKQVGSPPVQSVRLGTRCCYCCGLASGGGDGADGSDTGVLAPDNGRPEGLAGRVAAGLLGRASAQEGCVWQRRCPGLERLSRAHHVVAG